MLRALLPWAAPAEIKAKITTSTVSGLIKLKNGEFKYKHSVRL